MRTSNREKALDAVAEVIRRDGVTAVTFDAIAAETGLTRGGLLYHFPSREHLMQQAHKHIASQWEAEMEVLAGGSDAPPEARYAAYIQTCAQAASRVQLLLMLEAMDDPELAKPWRDVHDRWGPPVPADDDPAAQELFLARLAAEGLWIHEAITNRPLSADLKGRLLRAIAGNLKTNQTG